MVFTSLHNNYLPEVANMVIDAKFPGFVDKHLTILPTISDYIRRFEWFRNASRLIGKSFTIVAHYSDIFKDVYILSILIKINGGPRSLYDFHVNNYHVYGNYNICPPPHQQLPTCYL